MATSQLPVGILDKKIRQYFMVDSGSNWISMKINWIFNSIREHSSISTKLAQKVPYMNTIEEFLQCKGGNGILFRKLCLPTVRSNCSSDREFANILRSLEQITQTLKGQYITDRMYFTYS